MADEQRTWTESDAHSLDEKLRAFAATLAPGELALLEQRLAGPDDVQGFNNTNPTHRTPGLPPAMPLRPRPGSSAQPPR